MTFLWLILSVACRPAPTCAVPGEDCPSGGDGGTSTEDGGTDPIHPDAGSTDTGARDGGQTGDGGSAWIPDAPGFELLERDDISLAAWGLELLRFGFTADHPQGIRDLEDGLPEFYLFRALGNPAGKEPQPAVVWLHGGGAMNDAEVPSPTCTLEAARALAMEEMLDGRLIVPYSLVQAGSLFVVPVSPWCDMWTGLGPDDPVDPRHRSLQYLVALLDGLEQGLDQTRVDPARLGLWGSSLGAVGVFPVALHLQGLGRAPTAIVSDSGPLDIEAMSNASSSTLPRTFVWHVLGGPALRPDGSPTEWQEQWDRVAPLPMVSSGRLAVPLFEVHNEHDLLTPSFNGDALVALLEAEDPMGSGLRYSLDTRNLSPGSQFHTQTSSRQFPGPYTGEAARRFLFGQRVQYHDLEALCAETDCPVRDGSTASAGHPLTQAINQTGLVHTAARGSGPVATIPLPANLPTDRPVDLLPTLFAPGLDLADETPLVRMSVVQDGAALVVRELTARHLNTVAGDVITLHERLQEGTLRLDTGELAPKGQAELRISDLAGFELVIDGLWVFWDGASG